MTGSLKDVNVAECQNVTRNLILINVTRNLQFIITHTKVSQMHRGHLYKHTVLLLTGFLVSISLVLILVC